MEILRAVAVALAILVLLFLACRKFIWWYTGIGRAIRALESIDASLKLLPAVRRDMHQQAQIGRNAA